MFKSSQQAHLPFFLSFLMPVSLKFGLVSVLPVVPQTKEPLLDYRRSITFSFDLHLNMSSDLFFLRMGDAMLFMSASWPNT